MLSEGLGGGGDDDGEGGGDAMLINNSTRNHLTHSLFHCLAGTLEAVRILYSTTAAVVWNTRRQKI
jgi:hypothetical protein